MLSLWFRFLWHITPTLNILHCKPYHLLSLIYSYLHINFSIAAGKAGGTSHWSSNLSAILTYPEVEAHRKDWWSPGTHPEAVCFSCMKINHRKPKLNNWRSISHLCNKYNKIFFNNLKGYLEFSNEKDPV